MKQYTWGNGCEEGKGKSKELWNKESCGEEREGRGEKLGVRTTERWDREHVEVGEEARRKM